MADFDDKIASLRADKQHLLDHVTAIRTGKSKHGDDQEACRTAILEAGNKIFDLDVEIAALEAHNAEAPKPKI